MKKVWIARWEVVPGDGVHTQEFSTFASARSAMRQKITQILNLDKYISWLREEEPVAGKPSAAFLERYLSDPEFPRSRGDVPERYEDPEHCDLFFSSSCIGWDYWYDACPRMHTNLVLDPVEGEAYEFRFWYEHPENLDGAPDVGLSIQIEEKPVWGTSAYPVMVLEQLDQTPKTHTQIAEAVESRYGCRMDRKAVSRHIELLKAMGYPIEHDQRGSWQKAQKPLFTTGEKMMLLDCVRACPGMPEETRARLMEKLNRLGCESE